MADIEEKIEDAIEAEEEKAEAVEELAEAQAMAVTAAAAQTAVATAEAAAALANETAALAEVEAAKTVQQNEDELAWLKQHAAMTETALTELRQQQNLVQEGQTQMMTALSDFQQALQSLTLPRSTPETPEQITVNPENAGAEGQGAAEALEPPNLQAAAKRLKRWI